MRLLENSRETSTRPWRAALLAGVSCAALTGASFAATPQLRHVDTSKWRPMTPSLPPTAKARLRAAQSQNLASAGGPGVTIPYWTTSITSPIDRRTYTVSMVGSSPYDPTPHNTNVSYVPVIVKIHVGGVVVDPTAVSHCDTQSAAQRFYNSPLFHSAVFASNGVNVSAVPGGTQLISAFQRANFWNAVQGTQYGVTLIPTRSRPIVVDWYPTNPLDSAGLVPDNCGGQATLAIVNINEFNDELLAIAAAYATPSQVPVTLAVDTAIYVGPSTGNCCVLGYHNAVPVPGGTQVYAVGAYFDTNSVFGPHFADTTVWAHELGELIDDPFVQSIPGAPGGTSNDLTPSWGPSGQVTTCQNNLEVGDPLTPDQVGNYKNYPVVGLGGFVYHYQDLAFHDWFYRTPSSSTGGMFSFVGSFTHDAGRRCH